MKPNKSNQKGIFPDHFHYGDSFNQNNLHIYLILLMIFIDDAGSINGVYPSKQLPDERQ